MYRSIANTVRLDVTGEGIEMDCSDLTHVRGSIFPVTGDTTGLVVGFKFACTPERIGPMLENGTADRLTGVTVTGTVSSSAIDVRGFARVRMEVVTKVSTTDSLAVFAIMGYTPNTAFGRQYVNELYQETVDLAGLGGPVADPDGTAGGGRPTAPPPGP